MRRLLLVLVLGLASGGCGKPKAEPDSPQDLKRAMRERDAERRRQQQYDPAGPNFDRPSAPTRNVP